MNIVCVYSLTAYSTNKPLYSPGEIPFGISYIATVLKLNGDNVRLAVFTPSSSIQNEVEKIITEFKPDLLCLTAVSSQIPIIKEIGRAVKSIDPSIGIIMGGVHATLNPEETIGFDFVDAICLGEGEEAVVEYVRQLAAGKRPSQILNLWLKGADTGQVERNALRPFTEDLDSLPSIDRGMWEEHITHSKNMLRTVLIGRGCPNKCTYCSNHVLAKVTKGKYVRFRSPENIISEIRNLVGKEPDCREVFLEIETLGVNLNYTFKLLSDLADFNKTLAMPLVFSTNLALTHKIIDNSDLLKAFKAANFEFVMIGLESGSERIRKEVLFRPYYANDDIINFCRLAREYDLKTYLNVLIGLPGETRKDFEDTIDCVRKCKPTMGIAINIFFPYPGTKLFNVCKEKNLLKADAMTTISERTSSFLNLPSFQSWQIKKEYILFYYKIYKGYRPWTDIISKTFSYCIGAFPLLRKTVYLMAYSVKKVKSISK